MEEKMTTFLKKIEIQGFKSFAQKTELNLPAKIVGIVGPNGSGKSNIVDALRWALGERAAKHLRGESLGNLIFAGTPKRPAASLARVALHFTNKNNLFPTDAEEAVLERKIDRSGESKIFLNSAETKLKTLAPILARARLGTRGLTIISQGESDLFVKSSPEERRMMIEEILGLKEFRMKKDEAERKLETTRANTEKVRAMVDEIKPHLNFLKKQKHRWDRRSEIEKEGKELENIYFGSQIKKQRDEFRKVEEETAPLESQKEKKREEIARLEETLKEFEKKHYEKREERGEGNHLENLFKEKSDVEREITRIETRLEIQKSASVKEEYSVEELVVYAKTLHKELAEAVKIQEIETIKEKVLGWLKKLEEIFGKKAPTLSDSPAGEEATKSSVPAKSLPSTRSGAGTQTDESEVKKWSVPTKEGPTGTLRAKLYEIETKIEKIRGEERNLLENQQTINLEFKKQLEGIENAKNALRTLETRTQGKNFEKEKINMRVDELETQWSALGREREELEHIARKREEREETDWKEMEKKIFRLRAELSSIGEIDTEILKEAEETEKRYAFLLKELEDLEKASGDLVGMKKDLEARIHEEFKASFKKINEAFSTFFGLMFGGGKAKLKLTERTEETPISPDPSEASPEQKRRVSEENDREETRGVDFEISIPRKKIKNLDMLSGGEKSLVSLAALFSLVSISPPPFLVLDEIDAALDDENTRRFSELLLESSKETQFIVVTHNKITMETAGILYGITMGEDGVSKVLSLKLEDAEQMAKS
ncbi:MAG: AAA family ATPase [Candidatus Wolfebacteria bacterium]|nr:AAA family ATPase [Candidatus Wolfebacteria bacterium]